MRYEATGAAINGLTGAVETDGHGGHFGGIRGKYAAPIDSTAEAVLFHAGFAAHGTHGTERFGEAHEHLAIGSRRKTRTRGTGAANHVM